jgi:hypothetical protein
VTTMRQRMMEDLQIRNYAPATVRAYIRGVANFAKHFGKVTGPARRRTAMTTPSTSHNQSALVWGTGDPCLEAVSERWSSAVPRSHQRHRTASQGEARQFRPLFPLSSVPSSRAGAIQTAIQSS